MSPTYFAIHMTAAEKRLQLARAANDFPSMQNALAEMTQLLRAYYGTPASQMAA